MMKRLFAGLLLIGFCFVLLPQVLAVDTTDGWKPFPYHKLQKEIIYVDSSGAWRLVGAMDESEYVEKFGRRFGHLADPPVGKYYFAMFKEPADWLAFQVEMRDGVKLYWSEKSQIILITKNGREVVGQACFFSQDKIGTQVYDIRKKPIVIRSGLFEEGSAGPPVSVKFPWGTISGKLDSIVGIRVEGVIVQQDSSPDSSQRR